LYSCVFGFGLPGVLTDTVPAGTCKANLKKLAYSILADGFNSVKDDGKLEDLSERATRLYVESEISKLKLNQTVDAFNNLEEEYSRANSNLERCESRVTTLTNSIGTILNGLGSQTNLNQQQTGRGVQSSQIQYDAAASDKKFTPWFASTQAKFNETPKDCMEILLSGIKESGVYTIYPDELPTSKSIQVFCDMTTNGGGWTIFMQRGMRGISREDFYRNLATYEQGFGNIEGGDYYIGLKNLHALTSAHDQELRVDLGDWEGGSAWANYKLFWIGDSNEKYKLMIGGFSGNAGDAMSSHNGQAFSTHDHDNDVDSSNCATTYVGAWWFNRCHTSHLHGRYFNESKVSYAQGLQWKPWKEYYYSLKSAEMKIRCVNFEILRQIFL
jgi:ficolin